MIRVLVSLSLAVLIAAVAGAAPAQAQIARTYVSSFGNDGNDCNRLTPCRTFQRAHDNTLALGEITVLDPGGYGAVTITKGISIINDGVGEAGGLVSGGLNGITVNAGPADKISLRGLTVKGIGFGGGNGIVFNSGKALTIENCAIRNLTTSSASTGFGLVFAPTTASNLAVTSTIFADNDIIGVQLVPLGGGAYNAALSRVEAYNNGTSGIAVVGSLAAMGSTLNATVVAAWWPTTPPGYPAAPYPAMPPRP